MQDRNGLPFNAPWAPQPDDEGANFVHPTTAG